MQVVNAAETPNGCRLRVQAEGRVAVKSLTMLQPYFKALVVPLTDAVSLDALTPPGWERTHALYRELRTLVQVRGGARSRGARQAFEGRAA